MVPSFLMILREGIEVALIIGIIGAYLNAIGKREWMLQVWVGMFAAIGLTVAGGAVAYYTISGLGTNTDSDMAKAVEGVGALIAVGVLTYMTFWMRNQARHVKGKIHSHIDKAVAVGSPLALATLAFVSVGREAVETVLFMFSIVRENGATGTAMGASLGLAISASLGYAIYKGAVRIDLRKFFNYTSLFLIIIAAGLLMTAVHELIEIKVLPPIVPEVWNTGGILATKEAPGARFVGVGQFVKAVFGYREHPALLEIGAYIGYLTLALYYHFKPETKTSASKKRFSEKSESQASA